MKTLSVVVVVLTLLPAICQAQFGRGLRELTLSGSGDSSREFSAGTVSGTGELGWYSSPRLEFGLRQSFSWSRQDDRGATWNGATRLYGDYHFGSSQWRPYLGASLGIAYGDGKTDTTLFAGPEAGLKFYVQPAAFLFVQMEYQVFFEGPTEFSSKIDDGAYAYSFGAGYNF